MRPGRMLRAENPADERAGNPRVLSPHATVTLY